MRRQIVIMLLGLMTTLSLHAFANVESRENGHDAQPYKYIAGNALKMRIFYVEN